MTSTLLGHIPVSQHVADVNLTPIEMDGGDQSVFVPANVEHSLKPDLSAMGKVACKVLQTVKSCLHDFEPSNQGLFTVWVLFPKLA